jgi:hypothetical protein
MRLDAIFDPRTFTREGVVRLESDHRIGRDREFLECGFRRFGWLRIGDTFVGARRWGNLRVSGRWHDGRRVGRCGVID